MHFLPRQDGSARETWQGLKAMMGTTQKQQRPHSEDTVEFVNKLNQFYARFDVTCFSSECDHVCDGLVPSPVVIISEPEVTVLFAQLSQLLMNSACCPPVTKDCYHHLSSKENWS